MKISLNNIGTYRPEASGLPKSDLRTANTLKDSGNFDAIMIHSSSRQIQEKTFSESLSRQLASEVRQSASSEKIEMLRQQAASGTYKIDAYAIASRIMLTEEVSGHV